MKIGIDPNTFKWIGADNSMRSLRGMDKETLDEFIARGGVIKKLPPVVPTRVEYLMARPTHPESVYGQHLRGVL